MKFRFIGDADGQGVLHKAHPDDPPSKTIEIIDRSDLLGKRTYKFTLGGDAVEVDGDTAVKLSGNGHFERVKEVDDGHVERPKATKSRTRSSRDSG